MILCFTKNEANILNISIICGRNLIFSVTFSFEVLEKKWCAVCRSAAHHTLLTAQSKILYLRTEKPIETCRSSIPLYAIAITVKIILTASGRK